MSRAQRLRSLGNLLQLIETTQSLRTCLKYLAQYHAMKGREMEKVAGDSDSSQMAVSKYF